MARRKQVNLVDDVATLQRKRRSAFARNMMLLYWAMCDGDDELVRVFKLAADKHASPRRT